MLIPCIDLQNGQAVQLVHGRRRELAVSDVFAQLHKFRNYPWLHLIDLDAAMRRAHNYSLIEALCRQARAKYKMKVRVGGGIRAVARAEHLVSIGATQIIVGSSAFTRGKPNLPFLRELARAVSRKRVIIALDTCRGTITTHGWRKSLALRPQEVMAVFEPFCEGFLCTDVDREGTLCGANLDFFAALRAATKKPIIAAGGIKTSREVTRLENIQIDAAVGMALYKHLLR